MLRHAYNLFPQNLVRKLLHASKASDRPKTLTQRPTIFPKKELEKPKIPVLSREFHLAPAKATHRALREAALVL